MKPTILLVFAVVSLAAYSQTAAKPAAPAAKPATPRTAATHPAEVAAKLPAGIPPAAGLHKTLFALRYQDVKLGTGPEAEPNKLYKVKYTGWLAADGHKFDSSYDHPKSPVLDKEGKPEMDADGKPKTAEGQPIGFPQGFGRVIPGWDQGFNGMKIGGKRRLFIPWELAYGAKGRPGPDAAHPGIPPKADLIFDVELVDVTDLPMPPNHPAMPGQQGMQGGMPSGMPRPSAPPAGATGQPATPPPTPTPTPSAPAQPATPPQPQQK
jgi:peptidylprolyl isomerase